MQDQSKPDQLKAGRSKKVTFLPKMYVEVFWHAGLQTWAAEAAWDRVLDYSGGYTYNSHASSLDLAGSRMEKLTWRQALKRLRLAIMQRNPELKKVHDRVRGEVKLPRYTHSKSGRNFGKSMQIQTLAELYGHK